MKTPFFTRHFDQDPVLLLRCMLAAVPAQTNEIAEVFNNSTNEDSSAAYPCLSSATVY
ncbi:hypothetical protein PANT111_520047 [Pantoea brenneri]|jgi:hypothetical protein|uniref:Transposase n=1 Tax=Pantoea brenneri TaxID=472694 RepID=A0AAX3JC39_9GAMM|nr:hypothetical protein PANT111_520047 [Pantoea brenneri]